MRIVLERSNLLKSLNHVHRVVERRNTIPILSNVLLTRDRREPRNEGDRPRSGSDRGDGGQGRAGRRDHGSGAPALRHRPQAARRRRSDAEDRRGRQLDVGDLGPLELPAAVPAAVGFPGTHRRILLAHLPARIGGAEAADRQDAVRDLDRGDALLSQRHLPAHARGGRQAEAALGGDRRPPAGARRDGRAGRLRRHARHHHSAQDGERIAEAGRRSRMSRSRPSFPTPRSASRSAAWC